MSQSPTARLLAAAIAGFVGAPLAAQSDYAIIDHRNGAHPYASIFQVEAGAIGTRAISNDPSDDARDPNVRGLDDGISWDGRAYFRDEAFSSRRGTLEAYAGRDGLFAGYQDGKILGDDTVTRFEFRGRPWQFYRDGFYDRRRFQKSGFFTGSDYEGYIGFGREAQPGLYVELGPYFRALDFNASSLTPTPDLYTIPSGYNAYGARLYIEQSTVQIDRRRGMPRDGYTLSLTGEREWNNSNGSFGVDGFTTELPSAVWRARGRLDWYIPAADAVCWEIFANGGWHDPKDRLQSIEAQRPLGHMWGDVQLRLRCHLGDSMTLTPFVHGQYSRLRTADGFSSTSDLFFGGGLETYIHFSDAISLHGWYSYLDNDSRPSIRVDRDLHGQHMFYLGMVLRLGTSRR